MRWTFFLHKTVLFILVNLDYYCSKFSMLTYLTPSEIGDATTDYFHCQLILSDMII